MWRGHVCALALAMASHAQISGIVADPSGALIPEAEITLSRPGRRDVLRRSDGTGTFRFDGIATGSYTLRAAKPGFAPAALKVETRAGADTQVSIVLPLSDVQGQMTVTADADLLTTEPSNVGLSFEQADALPAFDNDVVGMLAQSLDPSSSAAGATAVVDGVEQPLSRVMSSTIDSVRIVSDGYSAEFTRPGRGRLEIVTKPGTNTYHGSFFAMLRDARFAARNAFATTRPNGNQRVFEASLTGPLRKDRTSFLFGIDSSKDRRQTLVFARTPAGDVREWFTTPADDLEVSAKVMHAINDRHSLTIGAEYANEDALSGVGGFRLPETATTENEKDMEVQGSWQAAFSASVLHQLLVRLEHESSAIRPNGSGPQINVEGAFTGGAAVQDSSADTWQLRVNEVLSIVRGTHNLRAGVQLTQFDWNSIRSADRFAGAWTFASLEDYAAGRPLYYEVRRGQPELQFWRGLAGAFVQDDWRLRKNLQIGLGLRTEWHSAPSRALRLAPRVSAAWAVAKNTRIRAGGGIFLESSAVQLSPDVLQFDGTRLLDVLLTNPSYPDPLAGNVVNAASPPNVVRFGSDARTPYLMQATVGIEQSFTRRLTGSARFIASRGAGLFRSRDDNAPLVPGLQRPDPTLGVVRIVEPAGRRSTNAMELAVRGRMAKIFNASVSYNLAFANDNTGGSGWFPANSLAPEGEWGRANFDRRHTLRAMGVAEISRVADVGIVLAMESGSPYTITTGRDDNGDGRANDRPAGVRRNTGQSPGKLEWDVRLSREFAMGTEGRLRMRASCDLFNAFNRVNRGPIVGNLSSPFFGQSVSAGNPRRMQFGLRFRF